MATVQFKKIGKKFGDNVVLNGVDVHIKDHEFVVIVGPSGCGKTTLLRMLAGLEEISDGEIFIDNLLVNELHPSKREIAMVFQDYALYPHMTVEENMNFALRLRKMPKAEIASRVTDAPNILQLNKFLKRMPKQLSGGQRQRVAVGRAIVREPAVFLFDEPLSNLDAKLRVQTRAEISKLHQRLKTTFIYVTHDQVEAMTMASRIAVLKDGILQQLDTPQKLYDHPANVFVAGFIGSPSMNFFDARLRSDNGSLMVDTGSFAVEVPDGVAGAYKTHAGRDVVFGIRPEDVHDPSFAPPGIHTASVETKVDVTELMGNEIFLYLVTGDKNFVGRVDPRTHARIGDTIRVALNMDNMHLFDKETEQAIR